MKRTSSFQLSNLVKSFTLFFFGFTILWALSNYIVFRDVLISWPVFIVNVLLSLGVGWWYYRQRYNLVFQYNQDNFELSVGKQHTNYRWTDFVMVSLYHQGQGVFFIRLYRADDTFVEIPATSLRFNPSDFRFEVMDLVKGVAKTTG
jgi:hypothetical protein